MSDFLKPMKHRVDLGNPWAMAEWDIYKSTGDIVSIVDRGQGVRKFGRHDDCDSGVEQALVLNGLGQVQRSNPYINETVDGNAITSIVSSSANDTGPVRVRMIYTLDAGETWFFAQRTVELNGQTPVLLPQPGFRCVQVRRVEDGNGSDEALDPLEGTVYVYEGGSVTNGVPDDLGTVHCLVQAGEQTSQHRATTVSSSSYLIITKFRANIFRQANASVDVKLRIRRRRGVFIEEDRVSISSQGQPTVPDSPSIPIIIPPQTDVEVVVTSTANNTSVGAYIEGRFANILSSPE